MKQKLLCAAITSAMAGVVAVPAWADVKVGGHAQVELSQEENTVPTGKTGNFKGQTVEDNSRGRFWITADEDLGNGMKGLAHYEFRVDTTGECGLEAGGAKCLTGSPNIREKYVGLQSGVGTIKLGSVRSPYKYAGGVLWDAFVTTNLEARGQGGMTGGVFGHNNFMDNSINYTTPTMSGLVVSTTYTPDDATTGASTATSGDAAAAVEWKGAGLHAIGAWSRNNVVDANDVESVKLGIRGNFGMISAMVQGENTQDRNNTIDTDTLFLGLQAKFGRVTGVVQLGQTKPKFTVPGGAPPGGLLDATDYQAVGGFYNFSKTFSAFGGYRNTETATYQNRALSVGLRKVF